MRVSETRGWIEMDSLLMQAKKQTNPKAWQILDFIMSAACGFILVVGGGALVWYLATSVIGFFS